MEQEYSIGKLADLNYETVHKIGLVFSEGRIYDVEVHQKPDKGPYTTQKDVTMEVALALRKELDDMESDKQCGKRCSKCGTIMEADTSTVYTSNPPMYMFTCPECGNKEYGFCSETYNENI